MGTQSNKFYNIYLPQLLITNKVFKAILAKYGIQKNLVVLLANLYGETVLNKAYFSPSRAKKLVNWNDGYFKACWKVLLDKEYIIPSHRSGKQGLLQYYKLAPIVNEIVRYYSNMHEIKSRTVMDKFK